MSRQNDSALNSYSQAYQTKLEIAKTMNALCANTPFSKLTIDAIVHEIGISRSSFYYHFTDKNAVVAWVMRLCFQTGIDEIGRTLTWFEGHLLTTRRFQQFQALLVGAEDLNDYDAAIPSFIRHRSEILLETLTDYQHKEATPLLRFQIYATAGIEINMTGRFRSGDFGNMKTKEFCDLLVQTLPRELFEALNEPVEKDFPKEGIFHFE